MRVALRPGTTSWKLIAISCDIPRRIDLCVDAFCVDGCCLQDACPSQCSTFLPGDSIRVLCYWSSRGRLTLERAVKTGSPGIRVGADPRSSTPSGASSPRSCPSARAQARNGLVLGSVRRRAGTARGDADGAATAAWVRIPAALGRPFRNDLGTDSGSTWAPIPEHLGAPC